MYVLTQSDFLTYLQLPKHFWAKVHGQYEYQSKRSSLPLQQLRSLGHEYIQQIVLPNFDDPAYHKEILVTQPKLKATLDGLVNDKQTQKTHLMAIRAATSLNRRFIYQLAYQKIAANPQHSIDRIFLVLLSQHYLRTGDISPDLLFQVIEVTAEVAKEIDHIKEKISRALRVADMKQPNELYSCVQPDKCPCLQLCHPNLVDYSIYDMTGLSTRDTIELRQQGIERLEDIPLSFLKDEKQLEQRKLTKDKSKFIHKPAIQSVLDELPYPYHFLDYEAYGFPVPLYPGYWPLSSVVFQYSLHTLTQDGQLTHQEFIHLSQSDPSLALIQSLKQNIPETGSIIVWDKTLESAVHNHLAQLQTQNLLFLLELNQRLFDLQTIFSQQLYVDYRFKGSLSLKKILPVISPELDHQNLTISNGLEAANEWYRLVYSSDQMSEGETFETVQQLKDYCALDTLGCVKIFQHLRQL